MEKIVFKPSTFVYPLPVVLVTCGNETKKNVFTVAWTGIINSDPAMTYISVRKERYSYDLIKENMNFVINLTTEKLAYATDYCGVKSGRNEDKFEAMNLKTKKANNISSVILLDSPINVECEVVDIKELGSHDMFIAKILAVNVDKNLLDEKGAICLEKAKLISYSHGTYYTLGNTLGKFGYSVSKNKKNKKK